MLDVLREEWGAPSQMEEAPASYLVALRKKMRASAQLAQKAHGKQKRRYDAQVKPRFFEVGQKVLLLLHSSSNKLLVQWQGPYEVIKWVGEANYRV